MKYSQISDIEEDSFGPGTDLVFSLVALLLIVIPVMLYVQSNLRHQLATIEQRYKREKPPIIPLQEASGYTFKAGSAELSQNFRNKLKRVLVPRLLTIVKEFNVNTIEIVGHTDSVPVSFRGRSNLDKQLNDVYHNKKPIDSLVFTSNTELGLLRALAVQQFLEKNLPHNLGNVSFRIYSAAQLIPRNGNSSNKNYTSASAQRRIELRFTKLVDLQIENIEDTSPIQEPAQQSEEERSTVPQPPSTQPSLPEDKVYN